MPTRFTTGQANPHRGEPFRQTAGEVDILHVEEVAGLEASHLPKAPGVDRENGGRHPVGGEGPRSRPGAEQGRVGGPSRRQQPRTEIPEPASSSQPSAQAMAHGHRGEGPRVGEDRPCRLAALVVEGHSHHLVGVGAGQQTPVLAAQLGVGIAEHHSGGMDQLQSRIDPGAVADIPAGDHLDGTAMLDGPHGQEIVVVHEDHRILRLEPGDVESGDTEGDIDHGEWVEQGDPPTRARGGGTALRIHAVASARIS